MGFISALKIFRDRNNLRRYDDDKFHREPFIAHFKVIDRPFDFTVINIHTDPDEATEEINELPVVISDARNHFPEPGVILLGDLNADGNYYDENDNSLPLRNSEYVWLITNSIDTTVAASENTYDRIIITSASVEDYANKADVFRFDQQFELDCETKEVSDHYPVFAEFSVGNDTDWEWSLGGKYISPKDWRKMHRR